MTVKRLRQVFIAAEDPGSLAEVLLRLGMEEQFRDGDRWIQFKAGDVSLALASPDEWRGATAGAAVPVLEVEDLQAVIGTLAGSGVHVADPQDLGQGHGRMAMATLPGGTMLALFER